MHNHNQELYLNEKKKRISAVKRSRVLIMITITTIAACIGLIIYAVTQKREAKMRAAMLDSALQISAKAYQEQAQRIALLENQLRHCEPKNK
jgi:hypothetical protein